MHRSAAASSMIRSFATFRRKSIRAGSEASSTRSSTTGRYFDGRSASVASALLSVVALSFVTSFRPGESNPRHSYAREMTADRFRQQRVSGLDCVRVATELLHRVRLAHPTAGVWDAADVQWWWRRPRSSDLLEQSFLSDA